MSQGAWRAVIEPFGVDPDRPLVTQVSRFDPWKDPLGVIDAFRLVRKEVPTAQLVMAGSLAHDDPEGMRYLDLTNEHAAGDPDIYLFTDLDGVGDTAVNAFQRASDVVVQKSLREGFGLVVAEGMWKGKPVVGVTSAASGSRSRRTSPAISWTGSRRARTASRAAPRPRAPSCDGRGRASARVTGSCPSVSWRTPSG